MIGHEKKKLVAVNQHFIRWVSAAVWCVDSGWGRLKKFYSIGIRMSIFYRRPWSGHDIFSFFIILQMALSSFCYSFACAAIFKEVVQLPLIGSNLDRSAHLYTLIPDPLVCLQGWGRKESEWWRIVITHRKFLKQIRRYHGTRSANSHFYTPDRESLSYLCVSVSFSLRNRMSEQLFRRPQSKYFVRRGKFLFLSFPVYWSFIGM